MCPLKVCNAVPLKLSNSFISARISILTEIVSTRISQREYIWRGPHFFAVVLFGPPQPQPAQFLPYRTSLQNLAFSKACIFTQRTQDCLSAYATWRRGQPKMYRPLPMLYSLLEVEKEEWRMCLSRWLKWEWTFRPGWTWVPSSPPARTRFKSRTFLKTVIIFSIYLDIRLKRSLLFWHRL